MNAAQSVILIMMGILILYLSWHPASPFNFKGNAVDATTSGNDAHSSTPGSSGESGLTDGSAGSGVGGGGGGTWNTINPNENIGTTYVVDGQSVERNLYEVLNA